MTTVASSAKRVTWHNEHDKVKWNSVLWFIWILNSQSIIVMVHIYSTLKSLKTWWKHLFFSHIIIILICNIFFLCFHMKSGSWHAQVASFICVPIHLALTLHVVLNTQFKFCFVFVLFILLTPNPFDLNDALFALSLYVSHETFSNTQLWMGMYVDGAHRPTYQLYTLY